MSQRVTAVIQARMGSTRLPGKVLRQLGSRSVLAHVVDRLRHAATLDLVVVATTTAANDDVVVREAERVGALVTRGSEADVLSRYVQAFDEHGGDVGVRITSDCPLIDPAIVDAAVLDFSRSHPPVDYLSNSLERTYPRGYDVEVFSVAALGRVAQEATDTPDREHVTRYFYTHPTLFRLGSLRRGDPAGTSGWRLTLDTPEDWEVISHVFGALDRPGPPFGLGEVETYLGRHPEVLARNAHIAQKVL